MIIGEHESFVGVKKQSIVTEFEFSYFESSDLEYIPVNYSFIHIPYNTAQAP